MKFSCYPVLQYPVSVLRRSDSWPDLPTRCVFDVAYVENIQPYSSFMRIFR